jgi:hypothetical protein
VDAGKERGLVTGSKGPLAGQKPRAGRSISGENDRAPDRETLKIIDERDCDELDERSGAERTMTSFAGSGERHLEEEKPRRGSGPVGG